MYESSIFFNTARGVGKKYLNSDHLYNISPAGDAKNLSTFAGKRVVYDRFISQRKNKLDKRRSV
jgi:hypothetical protein